MYLWVLSLVSEGGLKLRIFYFSKGMLFSFHTFKRISTLFSRHFAISSRPHDSLGAFGAKSTSPSPAGDLEVPMAAAQDLYLQLEISEFCERCCLWKISDRHLRSPLNKSTGVPQRSRCMTSPQGQALRGRIQPYFLFVYPH